MSLAELRSRTKPLHQRLDARLNLFTTVQTREQYREHLLRFYRVMVHAERELSRFPEWNELGIRWGERRKSELLRKDLLALGCAENELRDPGAPAAATPFGSFAESVGTLYVLEGSTLGAQYLSRHFGAKLSLTCETGLSFHTGYGGKTQQKWSEFCAALEKFFAEYPEGRDCALRAACEAFSAVEESLCSA